MTTSLRQLSGQSIGPYELRDLYGVGGMGAVYRAYHKTLDRDVGFKVMSLSYAAQSEFVERFEREAKLAASLEHPHIVPIYDYAAMEDWQYVVMRLLTGGSLAERIEQMKGQPPSLGEIASLLQQLSGALDYAHSRNIVHRDIKSNNIMFDTHGTAYIVDFGIAKLILDNSTRLTADGMTVGTPTHMAPELWSGEDASAASDQYALAIVVYELLTGRVPFTGTSPFALMNRHMQETPEPIQKYAPQLSSEFDMVLWRALSKERHDRYPTVTAFAKDFASIAQRVPQVNTGIFTMELRRELLGTSQKAAKPATNGTPMFSGMQTITPPSMPAPPVKKAPAGPTKIDPASAPAANGVKERPAIKSLSALQRSMAADNAAPIPSAMPKAEAQQPRSAASAAKPKAPMPLAGPALVDPEPIVKERIVFVERKDRSKSEPERKRGGLAHAIVDSFSNLFGATLSTSARSTAAFLLSGVFTVALLVGIGVGLYALLTSPAVGNAVNQLRASLESIGRQGAANGVQPAAATPVPQGPPPGNLPPPPPGGGLPPPPRR